MTKDIPFLRIILTSSPQHYLTAILDQYSYIQETTTQSLEDPTITSDIRRFIRHRLAKISKEYSLKVSPEWFSERDVDELAARSGSFFACAHSFLLFIAAMDVRDPLRQLQIILSDNVEPGDNPYQHLDNRYVRILYNAYSDPMLPNFTEQFRTLWVP